MLTKLALILPRLWQRSAVCLLALLACLALGYALAIPYLPDDFPGFASLHVVLAAGACVLLMLALLLVLLSLYRDSPENYRLLLVRWGLIVGGPACCSCWRGWCPPRWRCSSPSRRPC